MWTLYRFLSPRRLPAFSRFIHLWKSSGQVVELTPDQEVSNLSVGVGFLAAYSALRSPSVWLHTFDFSPPQHPSLNSQTWHRLQLPNNHGNVGTVKQVATGQAHLIALSSSGEVYGFGANDFGQCGTESSPDSNFIPQLRKIPSEHRFSHVSCGLDHSLFLTDHGQVLSCGWGADGQTGRGDYKSTNKLSTLSLPAAISTVSACGDTSFALSEGGDLYSWGNNEYGQLAALTADQQVFSPVKVDCSNLNGRVVAIATGGSFTAVLTFKGSVYYVGYGLEEGDQSDCTATKILPNERCKFRQLCDGVRDVRVNCDGVRVVEMQAGLNYLVIWIDERATIWGRYPGNTKLTSRMVNFAVVLYALKHFLWS